MLNTSEGIRGKGAKGRAPSQNYKISATYLDGYKATAVVVFGGGKASKKAHVIANSILDRSRKVLKMLKLDDFEKTYIQVIGAEDSFGKMAVSEDMLPR